MPDQSGAPALKRFLVGRPIPSALAHHERLSRLTGLAVLSSDALSSVAYATDFILITLIAAGAQAAGHAIPISLVIAGLLAVPTYFFVVSVFALIAGGAYRYATGTLVPLNLPLPPHAGSVPLGVFLLLTAFANGCTAMTGVEAVSNGVPAFRPPEANNAAATLVTMAVLAIAMFLGITFLAHAYRVIPTPAESGVSELARAIFGHNVLYYLLQGATTLILVLAANTAFADFPRLSSIVARDGYLPRQFMNLGDRLAFSNGILVLSLFAAILIIAFRADTQSLLPLYMIGVFISFTLSQAGKARSSSVPTPS